MTEYSGSFFGLLLVLDTIALFVWQRADQRSSVALKLLAVAFALPSLAFLLFVVYANAYA